MPRRILKHAQENPHKWMFFTLAAAIAASAAIGLLIIRDNPPSAFNTKVPEISNRELTLSVVSQNKVKKFVDEHPAVVAVQGVKASLVKNQRSTIFFYSDVPELQAIWDEYAANRGAPPKVFGSVENSNDRISNVINGAFDCRQFKDTVSYQYFPKANAITPWVCSISVPPGFDGSGDFTGFLTFYFRQEPTDAEKKVLAKTTAEISQDIYRRDVENASAQ